MINGKEAVRNKKMLQDSLVSIIVPIYNVETFLKECIDSILKQSYTNIEVLLIDDGSIDGSLDICKSYNDDRIRILTKKMVGCLVLEILD